MPKVATVGVALLFGTGCASEMARTPLQAMLLPPVDGKLALWINQPANFAVLGVGPERGTEVLYQQTALEAVPESGYVYVPMRADPDVDYEQVYLVASPAPIDLSAFPTAARDIDPAARVNFNAESMRYVLTSSEVVDGYQMADTVDRTVCTNRAILPNAGYLKDPYDPWRVYLVHAVQCERYRRSAPYIAPRRTFFTPVPRLHPPGKGVPPGRGVPPRPPPVEAERTMRYLAAKDEWHALTHHGEPGTELARAMSTSSNWSRADTRVEYATHASTSARSESPAPSHAASTGSSTSAPAHPH